MNEQRRWLIAGMVNALAVIVVAGVLIWAAMILTMGSDQTCKMLGIMFEGVEGEE